jgi:hypothetical protein
VKELLSAFVGLIESNGYLPLVQWHTESRTCALVRAENGVVQLLYATVEEGIATVYSEPCNDIEFHFSG